MNPALFRHEEAKVLPVGRVRCLKLCLRGVKRFDVHQMCLSFIGYEGSANVHTRSAWSARSSPHGGICAGTSPGELYDQKKFDTPYIRDFLLDQGALADVSETAAPWSHLEKLYDGVMSRAGKAFEKIGVRGYIMCHLAHSYHSGACLYFTFAFRPSDERSRRVRRGEAIQQGFIDLGGTYPPSWGRP
jgi:alkyldihydroxyacetonephosphate synthase